MADKADKADIKNTKTCPPKRTIEQTNKKTYISLIYVFVYLYLLGIHPSFHTLSRLLLFAVPRFLGCSDTPTLKTLGDSRESGARSPAAWLQGFDTPYPLVERPQRTAAFFVSSAQSARKQHGRRADHRPGGSGCWASHVPAPQPRCPTGSTPWQEAHPASATKSRP